LVVPSTSLFFENRMIFLLQIASYELF